MIANYTNYAANERAGARWVRQFSTALHRSKRCANRFAHAGRLCDARPPAAFRGLSIRSLLHRTTTSRGFETT